MAITIDQAYIKQYAAGIEMLVQQEVSRLMNVVRRESKTGELVFFDRLDKFGDMSEITVRKADTVLDDPAHSRRGIANKIYNKAVYLDKFDDFKLLTDPKSHYSKSMAMTIGRKVDDIIIAAAFGSALTGKDGLSTQALPSGQKVGVQVGSGTTPADVGLNIDKLIEAKKILMANEVSPSERVYCVASAKAISDLLKKDQIQSADYNTVRALVNGEIDTFMGMKFIQSERLGLDSSNDQRVLVFSEDALILNMPQGIEIKVDQRPDLNHLWQIAGYVTLGAVRLHDEKVVEIAVDPTVA